MKFKYFFSISLLVYPIFNAVGPAQAKNTPKCGKSWKAVGTVRGGQPSTRNSFPWLVAFQLRATNKFFCSGSLVSEKHVVSGE